MPGMKVRVGILRRWVDASAHRLVRNESHSSKSVTDTHCIAGLSAVLTMPQKSFPDIDVPIISVSIPYLGAAPEEVEQGVCIRVEEELDGVEGLRKSVRWPMRVSVRLRLSCLRTRTNRERLMMQKIGLTH